MWGERLAGVAAGGMADHRDLVQSAKKATAEGAVRSGQRVPYEGVVLGIDPSLRGTGLAVLEWRRGLEPRLLASATVRQPAKRSFSACLGEIHNAVAAMLAAHPVRHVALELTIYVQNVQTAQILGAARGAAVAAAAVAGHEVFEYPPMRFKQAVVGYGRASKEQVAGQVRSLLGSAGTLAFDEADAAAVAFCHALTWRA
jgi:crossover junction endodeoxyribonuclease RuvC